MLCLLNMRIINLCALITREFYIKHEFKLIQRYGRHSRIGAAERR